MAGLSSAQRAAVGALQALETGVCATHSSAFWSGQSWRSLLSSHRLQDGLAAASLSPHQEGTGACAASYAHPGSMLHPFSAGLGLQGAGAAGGLWLQSRQLSQTTLRPASAAPPAAAAAAARQLSDLPEELQNCEDLDALLRVLQRRAQQLQPSELPTAYGAVVQLAGRMKRQARWRPERQLGSAPQGGERLAAAPPPEAPAAQGRQLAAALQLLHDAFDRLRERLSLEQTVLCLASMSKERSAQQEGRLQWALAAVARDAADSSALPTLAPGTLAELAAALRRLGVMDPGLWRPLCAALGGCLQALDGVQLAAVLWSLVEVSSRRVLDPEEAVDQLAADVAARLGASAGQLDSRSLSLGMWSAVKLGVMDDALLTALTPHLSRKARIMQPQDFSNALFALASHGCEDMGLLESLAGGAERRLHRFDPQALANTAWALSKLGMHDAALMARLGDAATACFDALQPAHLCMLASAFAAAAQPHAAFLHKLHQLLLDVRLLLAMRLSPLQLSSLSADMQAMGAWPSPLQQAAVDFLLTLQPGGLDGVGPPVALAAMAATLQQGGYRNDAFYGALATALLKRPLRMSLAAMAQLVAAYGRLGYTSEPLYSTLAKAACHHLDAGGHGAGVAEAVDVLRAFAEAGHVSGGLLQRVEGLVERQGGGALEVEHSVSITEALAALQLPDNALLQQVLDGAQEAIDRYSPGQLARLLNACMQLAAYRPQLWDAAARRLAATAALAALTPPQLVALLSAMARHNHRHAQLLQGASEAALAALEQLRPKELAELAWSLASTGHSQAAAFERIAAAVRPAAARLRPSRAVRCAWGLAMGGSRDEGTFAALAAALRRGAKELRGPGLEDAAWALQRAGHRDGAVYGALLERALELLQAQGRATVAALQQPGGPSQRGRRRAAASAPSDDDNDDDDRDEHMGGAGITLVGRAAAGGGGGNTGRSATGWLRQVVDSASAAGLDTRPYMQQVEAVLGRAEAEAIAALRQQAAQQRQQAAAEQQQQQQQQRRGSSSSPTRRVSKKERRWRGW